MNDDDAYSKIPTHLRYLVDEAAQLQADGEATIVAQNERALELASLAKRYTAAALPDVTDDAARSAALEIFHQAANQKRDEIVARRALDRLGKKPTG